MCALHIEVNNILKFCESFQGPEIAVSTSTLSTTNTVYFAVVTPFMYFVNDEIAGIW